MGALGSYDATVIVLSTHCTTGLLLDVEAHHGGFSSVLLTVVVALAQLIRSHVAALDGATLAIVVRARAL